MGNAIARSGRCRGNGRGQSIPDTGRGHHRLWTHRSIGGAVRHGRISVYACPALLALALGLWGITREHSMWRDEAATWQASHRSLAEIVHLVGQADVVHGLYYAVMHGVFALFGDGLVT